MSYVRKPWIPLSMVVVLAFGAHGFRGTVNSSVAAQTPAAGRPESAQPASVEALYRIDKVWTVHLTFTGDAWTALTPVPPAVPPTVGPPVQGFIAAEGKRNGISGLRGLDFEYVHADLDFDNRQFKDVAVRLKGNGTFAPSQKYNKPSLKIDLNKYVKGQKLAGISTLNLHSSITDSSWLNEPLAYRLYRDAGVPAPRTAYARVYVTVPGKPARTYLGLYNLVENVDANLTQSRYGVSGGALFKPVMLEPFLDRGKEWAAYNQIYDPKTDLTADDQRRIIDFCDLVTNATPDVFAARVGGFVDLPVFAKYMAVLVWMANSDSLLQQGQNYYLYLHPKTRLLAFIPWDQDHSFGQFVPYVPSELQQTLDIKRPWSRPFNRAAWAVDRRNPILERMFALEAFMRPYLAELAALTRGAAQPSRLLAQVEALGSAVASTVADEPTREFSSTFKLALGDRPFPRALDPQVEVVPIKTFIAARHASVVAQLKAEGIQ